MYLNPHYKLLSQKGICHFSCTTAWFILFSLCIYVMNSHYRVWKVWYSIYKIYKKEPCFGIVFLSQLFHFFFWLYCLSLSPSHRLIQSQTIELHLRNSNGNSVMECKVRAATIHSLLDRPSLSLQLVRCHGKSQWDSVPLP